MTGDTFTLQASYVPLAPFRPSLGRQPAVVALPVPKPYGMRNISAVAIESSLPDAVGAYGRPVNEMPLRATYGGYSIGYGPRRESRIRMSFREMSDAIRQALAMPKAERIRRWRTLMEGVLAEDVMWWRQRFTDALMSMPVPAVAA